MALNLDYNRSPTERDKRRIVPLSSATGVNITDLIVHFQQSGSSVAYSVMPTESLRKPIINVVHENGLFKAVIKNLWQVYRYQQEYQSFLLGGYSEEEFLSVAEKYVVTFQSMPPQTVSWASSVMVNVLDNYLTSSDLSVLLNVDPSDIESSLASSQNLHAVPAEHRETHGQ